MRIDRLDLALFDVDKACDRLTRPGENRTCRMGDRLSCIAQRLNVRRGERRALPTAAWINPPKKEIATP